MAMATDFLFGADGTPIECWAPTPNFWVVKACHTEEQAKHKAREAFPLPFFAELRAQYPIVFADQNEPVPTERE